MEPRPLLLTRPPVLRPEDLARIEEGAFRILRETGLAVPDPDLLGRLRAKGFHDREGRVRIPEGLARAFLREERAQGGGDSGPVPPPVVPVEPAIRLSVSPYPQRYHDPWTDRVEPMSTPRLEASARIVSALGPRGVLAGPPGCPTDCPPPLQPLVQYRISAFCFGGGAGYVDAKSSESLPYVMEMAEVLGAPLRHLPVYVFSPLTLGGESLRCVLRYRDRLSSVGVSDMPSMGVSAPIRPGDAFALCAAEVIGAAILVREIVELPVRWGIRLCPMDPATLAMVLGSPEDFLLQLANAEVNAHFHGTRWHPAAGSIHTSAKLPGAQACAEKAGLMTAGALLGARRFGVAGTLSLDEIFSPEQLLYDVEIRDQVQRLTTGIDGTCDPERCAREVAEGVRQGGFAGLEATASLFRGVYWRPDLFERRFAAGWEGSGAGTIRDQVRERLRELTSMERRDPEPALRRELDRIVARAATAFGGGAGMSGGKR